MKMHPIKKNLIDIVMKQGENSHQRENPSIKKISVTFHYCSNIFTHTKHENDNYTLITYTHYNITIMPSNRYHGTKMSNVIVNNPTNKHGEAYLEAHGINH